jgi:exopolysaccharide biosynthesis polyprenyl glycosylphosphotransferase
VNQAAPGTGARSRTIPPRRPPLRRAPRSRTAVLRQLWHGARPEDPIPECRTAFAVAKRDALYRRSLGLVDAVAAALAAGLALGLIGDANWIGAAALCALMIVLVNKATGLYDRDEYRLHKTTLDEAPTIFLVAAVFSLVVTLAAPAVAGRVLHTGEIAALWILLVALPCAGRTATRWFVRSASSVERCLVVGDATSAARLQCKLADSRSMKAVVVGYVPLRDGSVAALSARAASNGNGQPVPPTLGEMETLGLVLVEHDVHRVIFVPHTSDSDEILDVIRVVKALGVKVSVLPDLFEVVGSSVEIDDVDGLPLMALRRRSLSRSSEILKRTMDIVVAGVGLAALAPWLAIVAFAIKLESPGPVLFRQPRIGRHGSEFWLLKFRTMVDGADRLKDELRSRNEADGLFKIAADPRITRIGGWLRRTHLDELPQLINVLRGEMSLVGPRPLVPAEDQSIEGWHRTRLHLTPGMTGHWQILGGPRVPLHEMVKIDHLYVANWSLWLDVKILLRTIPHVLARRGA